MTNHQKRLSVPKSWPVERKTETFTVKADAGPHGEAGVPLVVVLRDVLGYVDSTKEARYAISEGQVQVNGDQVNDEGRPIGMFDILAFEEREEYYRVFPDEGGRLSLTPIDEEAAGSKLGKIVNKKQIPGGETQLTLHDGQTLLVDEQAYSPKDSLIVGNDDNDIVTQFPYEEGALVTAVQGSHAGQIGEIVDIEVTSGSADNLVTVEALDGSEFETVEEYVVVIDENFIEDDEVAAGEEDADESDEDEAAESAEEEADEDEGDEEADSDEAAESEEEAADEDDEADAEGGDDE